jgi:DNA-binding transcriptional MerR regulator
MKYIYMKANIKYISLCELAIELGYNKSKLIYYRSLGLIDPIDQVGKMFIFDKDSTIKRLKKIEQLMKSGKKIREIKLMKF